MIRVMRVRFFIAPRFYHIFSLKSTRSLIFFRHRGRLHVVHLHPVLDGLQADRHLGQHADGLFLRFGLFKAGNDI